MNSLVIRAARDEEFDEIARIWHASWRSTGLGSEDDVSLEQLRARIPREIAGGWELFVAEDGGEIAAMLAFKRAQKYLDQLFVAPAFQGKGIGKRLLAFARAAMPGEIWLRTDEENARAIGWYEREGFVRERRERHPVRPQMMAYYRWKAQPKG